MNKENRKALPAFLLVLVISCICGGIFGYCSASFQFSGLNNLLKDASGYFSSYIATILLIALAIVIPLICGPMYSKAKKLLNTWDGEDEEVSDMIDGKLSIVIWLSGCAIVLNFFLISAVYANGLTLFDQSSTTISFIVALVAFVVVLVETTLLQQISIDATKKLYPEKDGVSVYDLRFQKKWLDNCDEAERIIIGKSAFKSYSVTNNLCCILIVFLALGGFIFDIGFLPSFIVCLIWIVNLSAYCLEAMKQSKQVNKIF